ncbi:MAG TPA: catalase family peroxidase [Lysobacter sp.]
MQDPASSSRPPANGARWVLIGTIVAGAAAAFAYVGGWLSPQRLTPERFVDELQQAAGVHPGYRRNHAKGVCVAGYFEGNGKASAYSMAPVFAAGRTPVVGRFAIPGGNPYAPDSSVPIRSMALRFNLANGQQWRTGMNNMPVFPVATPQAFHEQMVANRKDPATGKPDPAKLAAFFDAHPETAAFRTWAKSARPSASFVTDSYHGLNAFYFIDAEGERRAVRWRMVPEATDAGTAPANEKDYLIDDLQRRLEAGPARWRLLVTLAEPGDPTDDATRSWPADRTTVDAGVLVLDREQPQDSGPCRDVNFDPTVLPAGISISDDPLLPARAAVYADSYLRRTREEAHVPGSTTAAHDGSETAR